jgi:hypothetical protein
MEKEVTEIKLRKEKKAENTAKREQRKRQISKASQILSTWSPVFSLHP